MTETEMAELYQLLTEYGNAKFGDEWWPGNAAAWIGGEAAARLNELLDKISPGYLWQQAQAAYRDSIGAGIPEQGAEYEPGDESAIDHDTVREQTGPDA